MMQIFEHIKFAVFINIINMELCITLHYLQHVLPVGNQV